MENKMKRTIIYTLGAIIFALLGYFKDPRYYVAAILISGCAFYWIWKELKNK